MTSIALYQASRAAAPPQNRSPVTLAVLTVARDEGPYLKERLEYHKLVGVQRFFIYDNGSTDNTREVLEPYICSGSVVYHSVDGYHVQNHVWADALWRYKFECRYLAIIDADEFIVPVRHDTLPELLEDFEYEHLHRGRFPYAGLAVNWLGFDSNGHDTKPTAHGGLVTANYTRVRVDHERMDSHNNDRIIKCIVIPAAILAQREHNFLAELRAPITSENHEPVWGSVTTRHSAHLIQLNHYRSKSREEYQLRTQRNARWKVRRVSVA